MTTLPPGYTTHSARGLEALPVRTFHDIARLRQEVFVVEQDCAYLDLDGRDAETETEQYWAEDETGAVAATLRVLADDGSGAQQGGDSDRPAPRVIGRVATAAAHRGRALAGALVAAVVADHGSGPLTLEAQSHLTGWYGRFGFEVAGEEYLEDGIPHTPMRRG